MNYLLRADNILGSAQNNNAECMQSPPRGRDISLGWDEGCKPQMAYFHSTLSSLSEKICVSSWPLF